MPNHVSQKKSLHIFQQCKPQTRYSQFIFTLNTGYCQKYFSKLKYSKYLKKKLDTCKTLSMIKLTLYEAFSLSAFFSVSEEDRRKSETKIIPEFT